MNHSCVVPKRNSTRVATNVSCCTELSWKSGKNSGLFISETVDSSGLFLTLGKSKQTKNTTTTKNNSNKKNHNNLKRNKEPKPLNSSHLIEKDLKFYSRGPNVCFATSNSLEKKQDSCSSHYTFKQI